MSGSEPSTSMSEVCVNIEMVSTEEQDRLLDTGHRDELEDWDFVELKPGKHTIFLSHSGAQKNFVEQLCEDLIQAKQAPFFDKRPDSLPKGEKFAQLIFQAARQCHLAIVVVSEEYFTRSKWPMLELAAFVQARRCTILPLFLGLSCKEFGDTKRRQLWYKRWDEWAEEDPRIGVDVWKEAVKELDRRNGLEYAEALGEVSYRKEVVATACTIVQGSLQDEVLPAMQGWGGKLLAALRRPFILLLKIVGGFILYILLIFVFFKIIVPLIFGFLAPKPRVTKNGIVYDFP